MDPGSSVHEFSDKNTGGGHMAPLRGLPSPRIEPQVSHIPFWVLFIIGQPGKVEVKVITQSCLNSLWSPMNYREKIPLRRIFQARVHKEWIAIEHRKPKQKGVCSSQTARFESNEMKIMSHKEIRRKQETRCLWCYYYLKHLLYKDAETFRQKPQTEHASYGHVHNDSLIENSTLILLRMQISWGRDLCSLKWWGQVPSFELCSSYLDFTFSRSFLCFP